MGLDRITLTTLSIFSGLWWLLTGGALSSWLIGAPVVLIASLLTRRLCRSDDQKVALTALFGILPYFIKQSFRGSLEVGMSILSPRQSIQPGFVTYRTCLKNQRSQVFFITCINLLPGTLVVEITDRRLCVHLLNADADADAEARSELKVLEQKVSRIFDEGSEERLA